MGRKRKAEEPAKPKVKISKTSPNKKKNAKDGHPAVPGADDSDIEPTPHSEDIKEEEEEEEDIEMPPTPILYKLVDRLEAQLPKDDHVKYDSRAKKIDWKKVAWDELGPDDCKKFWNYIQDRIRRFRIMAELVPDARHWIAHPWMNFYKSKDHNRHPDMPKKPLSMYMLFYSEKRAEILEDNPKLSMPEVAKICSEQYQKLSDKKKARYKQRCDEMRREYEEKLAKFYRENPTLKPVKPEKVKKEKPPPPPQVHVQQTPQPQPPPPPQVQMQPQTIDFNQQIQIQQQQVQQQQVQLQQQQFQQQQFQQQAQFQQQQQEIQLQQQLQNFQAPFGMIQNGQTQQPIMVQNVVQTTNANGEPIYVVQPPVSQPPTMTRPLTALPPTSVLAQASISQPVQTQPPTIVQAPPAQVQHQPPPPPPQAIQVPTSFNNTTTVVHSTPQPGPSTTTTTISLNNQSYSSAPERPAKPFDLFFKAQMDAHASDPNFDRQSCAENYRQEWKTMKPKKKAKWIKKAAENFRDYEEKVTEFISKNPGYVPPQHKSFLTQEDQRILDKSMGRPEKPPSSAYSLFSKEMLNNVEIKKYPSKERMAQISEKWKVLPQDQKDMYQAEVNRSMSVYRQKYEDWFNALDENERKAETSRMSSTKSTRTKQQNAAAAAIVAAGGGGILQGQGGQMPPVKVEPKIVPVPAQVTPVGPPINISNLGPVLMQSTPQPPQVVAATPQQVPIMQQQPIPVQTATMVPVQSVGAPYKDQNTLRADILRREPVEPPRSPKQLFITEYLTKHKKKKPQDAKDVWKAMEKKEKKKWMEKLEPMRQKYIDDYTVFVRGLDKEELEMYTELKQRRDEEEDAARQNESSDSDSDSSDSDDSDSDSDSDSD